MITKGLECHAFVIDWRALKAGGRSFWERFIKERGLWRPPAVGMFNRRYGEEEGKYFSVTFTSLFEGPFLMGCMAEYLVIDKHLFNRLYCFVWIALRLRTMFP